MPWKDYILEQFESAIPRGGHDESQYYGPYNTLLTKDSRQLEPARIHSDTEIVTDMAPRERWEERKFREVMGDSQENVRTAGTRELITVDSDYGYTETPFTTHRCITADF
ncbi:hypothetical protein DFH27DRAFT_606548 [Peziza echinospora]|nr:hypothetical protein DFH27DRAFT_606548 [Peziza echinospora]